MTTIRRFVSSTAFLFLLLMGVRVMAAQETPASPAQADGVTKGPVTVEKPDPLKRPLSDKEKIAQQKALKIEIKGEYKKWLDEDVRWIITDQEMQAFKHLGNDEERNQKFSINWSRSSSLPRC